jgi:hypothetical protein
MIDEPNAEADEAHDIVMKQRESAVEYHLIIHSIIVKPVTEPIFSELATTVALVDEGGGLFAEVSQHGRADMGKIAIDPAEWPMIRDAIDQMIMRCK